MTNSLNALIQVVNDGPEYWCYENLIDAYCTNMLVPKIEDAFSTIIPIIEARHKFACNDDNEDITCVHYTRTDILFRMLSENINVENSFFRLYDSVHLNDPDEGNYLLRQLTQCGRYPWLRSASDYVWSASDREVAYIMSFVVGKNGRGIEDNLVFWRTYGNEGKGCSLMFPVKAVHLKKVLYGNEVNQTLRALEPILNALSSIFVSDNKVPEIVRGKTIEEIYKQLKGIIYLYKSKAYEYENEARVVRLESEIKEEEKVEKIHFDYQEGSVGSPRIRHYIEFECANLKTLLSSGSIITIGPTVPHQQNVLKCLEGIKRKIKHLGPQIKLSEISYRVP